MIFLADGAVRVTLNASTRGGWANVAEAETFLTACDLFLRRNRPGVVWTYGGDPVSLAVHGLAKPHSIPVLFALHNFAYPCPNVSDRGGSAVVPSEFARRHYRADAGAGLQPAARG